MYVVIATEKGDLLWKVAPTETDKGPKRLFENGLPVC